MSDDTIESLRADRDFWKEQAEAYRAEHAQARKLLDHRIEEWLREPGDKPLSDDMLRRMEVTATAQIPATPFGATTVHLIAGWVLSLVGEVRRLREELHEWEAAADESSLRD